MHSTAEKNAKLFYQNYLKGNVEGKNIIDFGSLDVNGCLKPFFKGANYIGIDQEKGPNVDLVCSNDNIPFKDNYFDVVLSSSCLEHDECFWMTFLEMCRVLKPGGFIYINTPSSGYYHSYPVDCWRFYPDSYKALEKWGNKMGYKISLLESYIDEEDTNWKDSIGIYTKL